MIDKSIVERVKEKIRAESEAIRLDREDKMDLWDTAEEYLGRPGRMLSGSKTAPKGERVVWNSNVCTKEHGKIWFGDLNITRSFDNLVDLAFRLNARVYILYEMDARFENELNPRFDNAVACFDQYGSVEWNKDLR